MTRLASMVIALLLLLVLAAPAEALRCGSRLVQVGDFKFEVQKKCGEPRYNEIIGYTLNRRGDREEKVEQWVYGPLRGIFYILRFEAGRLKRIERRIDRPGGTGQ